MKKLALLAILAIGTGIAAQDTAPFQIEGTGRGYASLQQAVDSIGAGEGTILMAPGLYRQCAVQNAGRVVFRAAVAGQVVLDGATCEDKAALVLRGRWAGVEGLVFQNMRVPDANGAGIRLERGDLKVMRAAFRDSEQGILTGSDPTGQIVIEQSTFSGLGRCDRGLACAHSLYVGRYGSLTVTGSRFERGNGGHYVKSRSARVSIADNIFDDTRGRATNYMIDLPNGAAGDIARNVFVQGADKENASAFISVAPEGRVRSSADLSISDNDASFGAGVDRRAAFVADWSGDSIALSGNRLVRGLKAITRR